MENLRIPAFGEQDYALNRVSDAVGVCSINGADAALLEKYVTLLLENGFAAREEREEGGYLFKAYQKQGDAVFVSFFPTTRELRIVSEKGCRYFDYADCAGEAIAPPQITQVSLDDFGMSYVIRLSDGRFIVIDGGFRYDADADALYSTLTAQCLGERIVIAAWILTHQHEDHFHCLLTFLPKYGDGIRVERFLFHFPAHNDFEHYPELARDNPRFPDSRSELTIPQMLALIEKTDAQVFTPHTGQKYRIGDAELECLSCLDDTIHLTQNGNATSLVFRMELGGQVILWTADASCSHARLAERYGRHLKADILQIPHHGFQSGTAEGEIAAYGLIDPEVCLLPATDYVAYTFFCSFRAGTRYLMRSPRVKELIAGSTQRTLVLPYQAREEAKQELDEKFAKGLANNGACAWIFTELSAGGAEELVFTLLNPTVLPVNVRIDLFFAEKSRNTVLKDFSLSGRSLARINLLEQEKTKAALLAQDLPENAPVAVRFLCDTPIVVSNPHRAPAYHSPGGMC